jgi:hypothetical protein
MTEQEFKSILMSAISGNKDDITKILKIYAPLINRSSYLYKKLDEDLRQHILMHIIKNISKFKI